MTEADEIYDDWIKETDALKLKADTPAVQVVGELTREIGRAHV